MKQHVTFFCCLMLAIIPAVSLAADHQDEIELTDLLHQFMAGASVNDAAMHDRFWAEELVYTSSAGARFGKAEIMNGLAEAANDSSTESQSTEYSAEDVDVRLYAEMAVIAFRLVGESEETRQEYFNTGTFRKIAGNWKAIAWQATRIPESSPD